MFSDENKSLENFSQIEHLSHIQEMLKKCKLKENGVRYKVRSTQNHGMDQRWKIYQ